ncbi:MAG: hypothetical protein ACT4QG_22505 [Sporichthyaceae bacterium]
MVELPEIEARLVKVESRLEEVAADAAAARHLAAAHDRDLADLGIKVDANRIAINALGEQTAARFDRLDARFERLDARVDSLEGEMRAGFAEMRGKFDQVAGGFEVIGGKLDELIERDSGGGAQPEA